VLVAVAVVVGVRMFGSHHHRLVNGGPSASATPSTANAAPSTQGVKLAGRITDESGVLTPAEHFGVNLAITRLDNRRGTHLWVVYVKNFGGVRPLRWAEDTMHANGFGDADAMLAVATDAPAFSFRVPDAVSHGRPIEVERIRGERIKPAVDHQEWARAALAAAEGLEALPG